MIPRDIDQMLRETVDPGVPVRPIAVGELPGEDGVGHQIEQVSVFLGVFQQRAEHGDEHRDSAAAGQQAVHSERLQPAARSSQAMAADQIASFSSRKCGQLMKVANRQCAFQNRPMVPENTSPQ